MPKPKTSHNTECTDAEHGKHLCFLMHEGYHLANKDGYRALVKDAAFRCENCGRTAKDAVYLCAPVPL